MLLSIEKLLLDEYELSKILSFRMEVEQLLNSKYGRYIETVSCLLSLASSALYVVSTYTDSISFLREIDLVVILLYALEFALKLYVS